MKKLVIREEGLTTNPTKNMYMSTIKPRKNLVPGVVGKGKNPFLGEGSNRRPYFSAMYIKKITPKKTAIPNQTIGIGRIQLNIADSAP